MAKREAEREREAETQRETHREGEDEGEGGGDPNSSHVSSEMCVEPISLQSSEHPPTLFCSTRISKQCLHALRGSEKWSIT